MDNNRLHIRLLFSALVITGLATLLYQVWALNIPLHPGSETTVWTIDAQINYQARTNRPAKVSLKLPTYHSGFSVVSERFVSDNYGTIINEDDHEREVVWSSRRPQGSQTLYYRATVYHSGDTSDDEQPPGRTYTRSQPFNDPMVALAANAMIGPIREQSADIETFVSETIRRLNQPDNTNAQTLLGPDPTRGNRAMITKQLLSLAHIPAEVVNTIPLKHSPNIQPTTWIRCYNGERWLYFDPLNGDEGLPDNLLPWWIGDEPVMHTKGAKRPEITFAVVEQKVDTMQLAQTEGRLVHAPFSAYNLYALPLQTQHVYQILLMVPVGVLIIVVLRTIVGIATFGTFTPVLIALAFRETQLGWGIFLFCLVTSVGLLLRAYLEHLRLLLLPRLGIILTFVILIMLLISLISYKLGLERGLSVALFPMVILSMTIERMSIVWEERGASEAMKTGLGSLLAATVAYLLMTNELATHIVFTFPGTMLIVLALLLAMGRYSGYRFSELSRFRALLESDR